MMESNPTWVVLVTLAVMAAILAGCGADTSGTTAAPGETPTTAPPPTTSIPEDVSTTAADPPPLGGDGLLDIGETRIAYDVNTHCGVEWLLRPVNEMTWRAVDLDETDASGIDPVPTAWGQANDDIDLELTLVDAFTLEATAVGTDVTVTYTPDPDPPGCD